MRKECRHYQSRTYPSGEVARWCALDLAPEAPWRCPDGCESYSPRTADVAWSYGSLVPRPTPEEPDLIAEGDEAAALLDQAENIVGMAGPAIVADVRAERERAGRDSFIGRIRDRFRRRR